MANELRFLDGDLLFDGGKLAMSEDCCCGEPCDCEAEGASPTAALSYEQTSDSPCTLNLFDESIPGTCGSIVSWNWYKNGVLVSTLQNPTGITYADGDDFTLEVTDTAGCTDSAVMEVRCYEFCCGCPIPDEVQLTFSGCTYPATDPAQRCICLNGMTGAIDVTMELGGGCGRSVSRVGNPAIGGDGVPYICDGNPAYESFTATLSITCVGGNRTISLIYDPDWLAANHDMVFQKTELTSVDCTGGWDLPWHHSNTINTAHCSTNCTAEIRW
jgi:hypothetical protein